MSMTWIENQSTTLPSSAVTLTAKLPQQSKTPLDLLQPLRQWLDGIEIHNPKVAQFFAKMIPAQCPFERDIKLFGSTILHIPPLCKLNPLYDELVSLRFRALCYLVDQCGEDIQSYAVNG